MRVALVGLHYGYIGSMLSSTRNASDVECDGLVALRTLFKSLFAPVSTANHPSSLHAP